MFIKSSNLELFFFVKYYRISIRPWRVHLRVCTLCSLTKTLRNQILKCYEKHSQDFVLTRELAREEARKIREMGRKARISQGLILVDHRSRVIDGIA